MDSLITIYTNDDNLILSKATEFEMPLIGGTALELLANYYHVSGVRKRSNNDFDFIADQDFKIIKMKNWLAEEINPKNIQVDIMSIKSHKIPLELVLIINNILVMSPIYLIWSKLGRCLDRDKSDIYWLLKMTTPDELEKWLEKLGVTLIQVEILNKIIKTEYKK